LIAKPTISTTKHEKEIRRSMNVRNKIVNHKPSLFSSSIPLYT